MGSYGDVFLMDGAFLWFAIENGVDQDVFFFFFSSRRRHTRCSRDWSSDVCSSDLPSSSTSSSTSSSSSGSPPVTLTTFRAYSITTDGVDVYMTGIVEGTLSKISVRSEERRVGKESRSRWSRYH